MAIQRNMIERCSARGPASAARLKKIALACGRVLALAFGGLCAFMFLMQRRYIYYPERSPREEQVRTAGRLGLDPWLSAGGEFQGWRRPAAGTPARGRWLVFHGNAGQALDRLYFADILEPEEVYIFEYPGYGSREGRPSEKAIIAAAVNAVSELSPAGQPLFLLGESLGSGAACAIAASLPDRVAGLVLITPFASLADVGQRHFPFLPVRLLLRERFDSEKALAGYRGPVAFVLAEKDEIVPVESGRRLHDTYAGPKRLWVVPGAGHNSIAYDPQASWWREASAFMKEPGSAGIERR